MLDSRSSISVVLGMLSVHHKVKACAGGGIHTVYCMNPNGMSRASRRIFTKTVPNREKRRVISPSRASSDFS